MFKFRKEHLDAFEAQAVRLFTSRLVAHVKAVWPAETAELGDAALGEAVRASIKRAVALGLSAEFDVVRPLLDRSALLVFLGPTSRFQRIGREPNLKPEVDVAERHLESRDQLIDRVRLAVQRLCGFAKIRQQAGEFNFRHGR